MGRFARIDSRFVEKKNYFLRIDLAKKGIARSEDWTRITRISMRIGEKPIRASLAKCFKNWYFFCESIRANLRNVGVRIACYPPSPPPISITLMIVKGRQMGEVQTGVFPIWTCPSFFVLFCPFWDFPDFSGIFPICSGTVRGFSRFVLFFFLGLLRAPTRNSPERVRDTIWTFPEKSGKPPGLETPPV